MKITRRNFIASVVGGVVGIQVTPLPWKITDDVAIWTQNWPWVPVPPVGAVTREDSVCTLCPGGCGISVRKVAERAVKIEGRTDYPINPSGICPLGMGGLQLLYDNNMRFPGPMKRAGARGAGQFVSISWGEAYDILAGRINALRKSGRPEALAAVDGSCADSTTALLIERLTRTIGSPNYVRTPSITDTYAMGNLLMTGKSYPMAYDLENSDFILSFGSGLLEGWGAPGRVMNAWGMWHNANPAKRRARVVQVDSRASSTASKANFWVAPRPGTEGALALGIVHVLIQKGRFDQRFVRDFTFGFDDTSADGQTRPGFKSVVLQKYSPAQVEKITGVDADTIMAMAEQWGRAKAPVAVYGKGKNNLNGSLYEFMAVQSLNGVAGRINKPGGVVLSDAVPLSSLPDFEPDAVARNGLTKPRIDGADSPRYPFTHSLINHFAAAINSSSISPVDTLMVFSANPYFTVPDGGGFKQALEKIPFIVSFSPYRDETANMADLILPDHNYLEKTEDVVWPVGLQYPFYGLSKPVVAPVGNTRNVADVVISLSKAIGDETGKAFPWENFEEVLELRARGLFDAGGGLVRYDPDRPAWKFNPFRAAPKPSYESFDDMWDEIKSGGMWYRPVTFKKSWRDLFDTPSGQFEFVSQKLAGALAACSKEASSGKALEKMGVGVDKTEGAMAHYEVPRLGVDRSKYPLFMVPYEMINLAGGFTPTPPFLYKTIQADQLLKTESFAAVNPETASRYGLRQGDRAVVQSPMGKLTVLVNLFEGAMPGMVYMPLGFGHTAYDDFQKGKGVNPNDVVKAFDDPVSGFPVWWNTPVKLIKV